MEYRYIMNQSKNKKKSNIRYTNQKGGDECGFNPKTNRCSKTANENPEKCILGEKGRCRLKKSTDSNTSRESLPKSSIIDVPKINRSLDRSINLKFEKKALLKYIKGPNYSFYLPGMKLKGEKGPGRNFLIFGEYHGITPNCESGSVNLNCFHNWIKYVAENSPYCLDFFLETTSYSKNSDKKYKLLLKPKKVINYEDDELRGGGTLQDIRQMFKSSDLRIFKNTRMHSVDTRLINQIPDGSKLELDESKKYLNVDFSFFDLVSEKKILKKMNKKRTDLIKIIIDYLCFITKIPKQKLQTVIKDIANKVEDPIPISIAHYTTMLSKLSEKLIKYTFLEENYDVIEDFLKPKKPKYFKLVKIDNFLKDILESEFWGNLFVLILYNAEELDKLGEINDIKTSDLLLAINNYLEFANSVITSFNIQISYYKDIIEKQLKKSLLTKNHFIKNADIWFGKDEHAWWEVIIFLEDKNNTPNMMTNLLSHSFVMDIYSLSRMFSKFDESKLYRGPLKCRDPLYKTPRNIIFYGGNGHSYRYTRFIERLNQFNHSNMPVVISPIDMIKNSQCDYVNLDKCKHIDYRLKKEYKNGFNFFENVI